MKNITDFGYHSTGVDLLSNTNHFHDDSYEILHVISGNGSIIINNKLYSLNKNDIYLIDGAYLHCTVPEEPEKYVRNKVVVDKLCMKKIMETISENDVLDILFNKNGGAYVKLNSLESADVDKIFLDIFNAMNRDRGNLELFVVSQIMYLIFLCCNNISENVSGECGIIESAIRYINKNLSLPMSIDAISKNIHVNKYYLCHVFKKETGITVSRYITSARISLAKELLIKTQKSVSDVAIDVGFNNFSHFSTTFSKVVGVSPNVFRKEQRKQLDI